MRIRRLKPGLSRNVFTGFCSICPGNQIRTISSTRECLVLPPPNLAPSRASQDLGEGWEGAVQSTGVPSYILCREEQLKELPTSQMVTQMLMISNSWRFKTGVAIP